MLNKYIKKFKNGDISAFDEIYRLTHKSVYYTALSVLRDKYAAEDVMQSTYLKVVKNIESYKKEDNPYSWILKIAKNEALNIKKNLNRIIYTDVYENPEIFGASEPDEYGLLTDLARRILKDDEFEILMLVAVVGYKRREISSILDMPLPTVTWKYNNALKRLRQAIKDDN